MKVFKTRKATIDNYTGFLNSFIEDEKTPNNKVCIGEKVKHFKINTSAAQFACKIGLLKKIGRGKYQPTKVFYEPKDGRILAQEMSNYVIQSFTRTKQKQKPLTLTIKTKTAKPKKVEQSVETPNVVAEPSVIVKHIQPQKAVRVFSLFWGLIKFNY